MNDEIKKILDYWQFYINEPNNYKLLNVYFDEIKKVLDYITNLQQEINKLTAESTEWESKCYDLQQENERLKEKIKFLRKELSFIYDINHHNLGERIRLGKEKEDYKSRCEKAIEVIKNKYPVLCESEGDFKEELLNILQNGSEKDG